MKQKMVFMRNLLVFILLAALVGCDSSPEDSNPTTNTADSLPDFSEFSDVKEKKRAFFEFLLPLVHEANARILNERQLIEKWQQNKKLTTEEQQKLEKIRLKYRVTTDDIEKQEELLLRRVQVIPPSIVLAQAANESAWGNSRFAREGNNLFGQWCFTEGCGMIPGARGDNASHEVQIFNTPFESVNSYMRNLNSHQQYHDLRVIREQSLIENEVINGLLLAEGLLGYSERGEEYVLEIQNMIRFNKLQQLDDDPLGESD